MDKVTAKIWKTVFYGGIISISVWEIINLLKDRVNGVGDNESVLEWENKKIKRIKGDKNE